MKQWGGRYLSKPEAFPPSHHHLQTLPLQLKLKLYRLLAFLTRNQFTKILQHTQIQKPLRIANCELRIGINSLHGSSKGKDYQSRARAAHKFLKKKELQSK
ncbi:hypothetical protein CLI64_16140 [Nostoc sp. CENA543]|uniref:hypothetical protein n=1 Tax=Nostoc sp. CENA543 TaxID=1869241 RepID=UPI000CA35876|nr:hypothetical protein [Nostoc sp. CENA543]AUT01790.1 hypothetical protein CLI64_16140 [Nostoc sp. CENA543]